MNTRNYLERLSKMRILLQNPYAFSDQLETLQQTYREASPEEISLSRKLLGHPYAFVGENGAYEAISRTCRSEARDVTRDNPSSRTSSKAWSDGEIEAKARELHIHLWRQHKQAEAITYLEQDPVELLDPAVALQAIGYDFRYEEGLGQMRGDSGLIEIGGRIDNKLKVVSVGRQFSGPVRRFTAAHELGHAILHPQLAVMHQDKPIDGYSKPRDRIEIEANKFATFFLMPAKLVTTRFAQIFLASKFDLTEESAFALAGCSLSKLKQTAPGRRELSRMLASAERFNGQHVQPLHTQFRVSREAMAIRLEELSLA